MKHLSAFVTIDLLGSNENLIETVSVCSCVEAPISSTHGCIVNAIAKAEFISRLIVYSNV